MTNVLYTVCNYKKYILLVGSCQSGDRYPLAPQLRMTKQKMLIHLFLCFIFITRLFYYLSYSISSPNLFRKISIQSSSYSLLRDTDYEIYSLIKDEQQRQER